MPEYAESNFLKPRAASRLLLDGRDGDELHGRSHRRHEADGLCPSHPAADGDGELRAAGGDRACQVEEWYLLVYADAFEWVELPNTHGMALFADGGVMASKPYAASGAYIDRMSDYCDGCAYDPDVKIGKNACPFNILYWDFLIRNEGCAEGKSAHGNAVPDTRQDGA
jgi:hypothetical protein